MEVNLLPSFLKGPEAPSPCQCRGEGPCHLAYLDFPHLNSNSLQPWKDRALPRPRTGLFQPPPPVRAGGSRGPAGENRRSGRSEGGAPGVASAVGRAQCRGGAWCRGGGVVPRWGRGVGVGAWCRGVAGPKRPSRWLAAQLPGCWAAAASRHPGSGKAASHRLGSGSSVPSGGSLTASGSCSPRLPAFRPRVWILRGGEGR